MADDSKVQFVRALHSGFGWEYGRAVRFEGPEGKQRALVSFGDGTRDWCDQWEAIGGPLHPVDLATEVLDLLAMIPDDEGHRHQRGSLKAEALEAVRRLRSWFD